MAGESTDHSGRLHSWLLRGDWALTSCSSHNLDPGGCPLFTDHGLSWTSTPSASYTDQVLLTASFSLPVTPSSHTPSDVIPISKPLSVPCPAHPTSFMKPQCPWRTEHEGTVPALLLLLWTPLYNVHLQCNLRGLGLVVLLQLFHTEEEAQFCQRAPLGMRVFSYY